MKPHLSVVPRDDPLATEPERCGLALSLAMLISLVVFVAILVWLILLFALAVA